VALLVLVAAAALTALLLRGRQDSALLRASIPERPDSSGWHPELLKRMDNARARIFDGQDPVAALGEIAMLYHANGYPEEARQAYDGLMRLDPGNARWPHLLAGVEADFGLMDRAIPLMGHAAELDPAYLPARLHLGEALLKLGRADEARGAFEAVLAREAENPYALAGLARIEVDAGRPEAALPLLERATTAEPEFGAAWAQLSAVRERLGDVSGAQEAGRSAATCAGFNTAPDPWSQLLVWHCYDVYRLRVSADTPSRLNDEASVLSILERAARLAPADGEVAREYGVALDYAGHTEQAEVQLRRAVELAPGSR